MDKRKADDHRKTSTVDLVSGETSQLRKMQYIHATYTQHRDQYDLDGTLHLQFMQNDYRKNGVREIAKQGQATVKVGEVRDGVAGDTISFQPGMPEFRDRVALKNRDEDKDGPRRYRDQHHNVYEILMRPDYRKSQEEDTDGEFGESHGQAIPRVT
jgi:hypothetical protein